MNFFEQELRKIMAGSGILKDQKYVGRLCYGTIGEGIRARVEIVTTGMSSNYDGIKASIINRKEGVVDSILIRLSDAWGKKPVRNPNFKDGIIPRIWNNDGKMEWYVYKPSGNDYRQLAGEIEQYLSVFQDMEMVQEQPGNGMQQTF